MHTVALSRTILRLVFAASLLALAMPGSAQVGTQIAGKAAAQNARITTRSPDAASSLTVAISLPQAQTNGVAIGDGRTFLVIPKQKGQDVPQLAEYSNGQLKPYPDASWNAWKEGSDATRMFVHANSVRFGPDGTLWVVDFGSPELGKSIVKHGPKLVGINIGSGQVVEVLYFDALMHPESALDDVRFNGDHAYLTDAGWPGIIVVHTPDGAMYRTLTDTPSVRAQKPLRAEGHELQDKHGKPIYFHADQIEVSPDGKLVYYQPNTGPMSVVDASALNNPNMPDRERVAHVRPFLNNGTVGGTAIDSAGNIYVSDCDNNRVLRVTPDGKQSVLVQDPRLIWVDAMWITPDGRLWMPAAQMNRTPTFNNGKMSVQYPMQVFTVNIGNGPPANDHR